MRVTLIKNIIIIIVRINGQKRIASKGLGKKNKKKSKKLEILPVIEEHNTEAKRQLLKRNSSVVVIEGKSYSVEDITKLVRKVEAINKQIGRAHV